MNNETVINPEILQNGDETVINNEIVQNTGSQLEKNSVFCGKYRIKRRLMVESGEADLYLCSYNELQYVIKLYRRNVAVKSEVIRAVKNLSSKHIAKIVETGTYNNFVYEILEYYRNGSLKGQTFSYDELKNFIIPNINIALNELHSAGIIHKDLKPSNLMISNDNQSIVISDFGISSVMGEGNTILLTRTGMTPEYSAPETFRNVFLEESDYYSLGITIYELFCGHTPYQNMTADEIARFMAIQNIPFPKNMPDTLKELISALTYNDITNRNNEDNPNRRWTFKEVENWCKGKVQSLPGNSGMFSAKASVYTFCGENYSDIYSLSVSLAKNWNEGINHLSSGLLSNYFRNLDSNIAYHCMESEKLINQNNNVDDVFYDFLKKLNKDTKYFFWKGKFFRSLSELSDDIFADYQSDIWKDIIQRHLISDFVSRNYGRESNRYDTVYSLEKNFNQSSDSMVLCMIAYIISEDMQLKIGGKIFDDLISLSEYVFGLAESDFCEFKAFISSIMESEGKLYPQVEAWFNVKGFQDNINKWKEELI